MILAAVLLAQTAIPYREFEPATLFCSVSASTIDESSGLAQSKAHPTEIYTHNDSGDTARFFRVNSQGSITGTFLLNNVSARDWEGMAIRGDQIYLGDIGDNPKNRANIQVHQCTEPTSTPISQFKTYTLNYPDGPRDAECLMVHPKTGDLWIVSKVSSGPSSVYRLPAPSASGSYTLIKMGTVPVGDPGAFGNMVTDGAISPDGKYVVLRTYTAAFEFKVKDSFEKWFEQTPTRVSTPTLPQSEGICYGQDGRSLYISSEGNPCPVYRMRVITTKKAPKS